MNEYPSEQSSNNYELLEYIDHRKKRVGMLGAICIHMGKTPHIFIASSKVNITCGDQYDEELGVFLLNRRLGAAMNTIFIDETTNPRDNTDCDVVVILSNVMPESYKHHVQKMIKRAIKHYNIPSGKHTM